MDWYDPSLHCHGIFQEAKPDTVFILQNVLHVDRHQRRSGAADLLLTRIYPSRRMRKGAPIALLLQAYLREHLGSLIPTSKGHMHAPM